MWLHGDYWCSGGNEKEGQPCCTGSNWRKCVRNMRECMSTVCAYREFRTERSMFRVMAECHGSNTHSSDSILAGHRVRLSNFSCQKWFHSNQRWSSVMKRLQHINNHHPGRLPTRDTFRTFVSQVEPRVQAYKIATLKRYPLGPLSLGAGPSWAATTAPKAGTCGQESAEFALVGHARDATAGGDAGSRIPRLG